MFDYFTVSLKYYDFIKSLQILSKIVVCHPKQNKIIYKHVSLGTIYTFQFKQYTFNNPHICSTPIYHNDIYAK